MAPKNETDLTPARRSYESETDFEGWKKFTRNRNPTQPEQWINQRAAWYTDKAKSNRNKLIEKFKDKLVDHGALNKQDLKKINKITDYRDKQDIILEKMREAGILSEAHEEAFQKNYTEYVEGTEQDAADVRRFQEQCFLIDQWSYYTEKLKENSYNNFVKCYGGDPQSLLTRLTTPPNCEKLMKATPEQLSGLIPSIKLYKMFYPDEESADGVQVELPFKSYIQKSAIEQITKGNLWKGDAAGIKSFSWNLSGTNQFESERMVSATLVLFFQDIDTLDKVVKTKEVEGKTFEARYLDLFYQDKKYKQRAGKYCSDEKKYNEKYFRIKATVGWSAANDHPLKNEIKSNSYDFFLSMIKHDIDFRDNGTIEVTLEYQAMLDAIYNEGASDILRIGNRTRLDDLKAEKKCIASILSEKENSRAPSGPCGATNNNKNSRDYQKMSTAELKEVKTKLSEKITELKSDIYSSFLSNLENGSGIYFSDIESHKLGEWKRSFFGFGDLEQQTSSQTNRNRLREGDVNITRVAPGEASLDVSNRVEQQATGSPQVSPTTAIVLGLVKFFGGSEEKNKISASNNNIALEEVNPGITRLYFISLGAILNTAFSVLSENRKSAETRHIVGEIQFDDPRTGFAVRVNLADLPISLNLFKMWFYKNCVAKELESWSLKSFLNSLMNSLFLPALSVKCFDESDLIRGNTKTPRLSMTPFQLQLLDDGSCPLTSTKTAIGFNKYTKGISGKTPFRAVTKTSPGTKEEQATKQSKPGSKAAQYLYLFANNLSAEFDVDKEELKKDVSLRIRTDKERSIYHFKLGKDRGIVKNIQFSKVDSPYITSMRIIDNPTSTGAIREFYDAQVTLTGNTMWKPGATIWIEASNFGAGRVARKIGLGGYYMVLEVNSSLAPGNFETSLRCTWISSGEKTSCDAATKKDPVTKITDHDKYLNCVKEKTGGGVSIKDLRADSWERYGLVAEARKQCEEER